MMEIPDDKLREMWVAAGGRFFGPKVETGAMPESNLLPLLRGLLAAAPTLPAQEPVLITAISTPEKFVRKADGQIALIAAKDSNDFARKAARNPLAQQDKPAREYESDIDGDEYK